MLLAHKDCVLTDLGCNTEDFTLHSVREHGMGYFFFFIICSCKNIETVDMCPVKYGSSLFALKSCSSRISLLLVWCASFQNFFLCFANIFAVC